jgi:hypothetical protein
MEHEQEAVCALVVETCTLLERGARSGVRDDRLAAEAALLLDDLTDRVAGLADPALADDAAGAAAELDLLLQRLDRLPVHVPALTG